MGSLGPPSQPWQPYGDLRDCSMRFCSIYCPQWCYFVFPPPPPPRVSDASGVNFSPLVIGIIGVLASAFLLICYYTVVSRYCSRARRRRASSSAAPEFSGDGDDGRISTRGLDEAAIKSIAVHEYRRGGQLADATGCSVCLSEFVEEEKVRLLPKCGHAFHVPCIDTWLKSHSNCPLCRANVLPPPPPPLLLLPPPPPPPPLPPPPPTGHNRVMSDLEMELGEGVVQPMRRSMSMDSICQGRVTVGDVVRIDVKEDLGKRWEERGMEVMKRSASSSSTRRLDLFGGRSCSRGGTTSLVLPL